VHLTGSMSVFSEDVDTVLDSEDNPDQNHHNGAAERQLSSIIILTSIIPFRFW